jgi:hypothetical protein
VTGPTPKNARSLGGAVCRICVIRPRVRPSSVAIALNVIPPLLRGAVDRVAA